MKTRFIIAFVLVPAISRLCDTTWAIGGNMGGGNGSSATPYLIEDFADFQTFTLPAHAAAFWAAGVHTRLEADLDLNPALPDRQIYDSAVIAPDANSLAWDFQGPSFAGVFDGNRYRIRNLTIHIVGAENGYLGLFGYIDLNGELKDLILESPHITIESSGSSVGGV
ncbi:MAG: hypothetical protein JW709_01915, partial [Sedimentisphaerales bacterium]|nr:hypothetical protein [Sedimentisphaerales bacterium]